MNLEQTSQLLIYASSIDNRNVTPENITGWQQALDDINYDYAIEAVKLHYKQSDDWLMPKHVRANAKLLSNKQALNTPAIENRTRSPQPICKHDLLLTKCMPCCQALAAMDGIRCAHEYNSIRCHQCTRKAYSNGD